MSFEHEARAIADRITAAWTSPPRIFFEDDPRPEGLTEWVVVSVRPAAGAQIYVGIPTDRHAGVLIGQCFASKDNPANPLERARELGDLFRAVWRNAVTKLPLTIVDAQAGTIRFEPAYVSETRDDDGLRQLNVAVPYSREFTTT